MMFVDILYYCKSRGKSNCFLYFFLVFRFAEGCKKGKDNTTVLQHLGEGRGVNCIFIPQIIARIRVSAEVGILRRQEIPV